MNWKVSMNISCMLFLVSGSVMLNFWGLYSLGEGSSTVIEWELWSLSGSAIVYILVLDWISLLFLSFVLLISSMVLYYSGGVHKSGP